MNRYYVGPDATGYVLDANSSTSTLNAGATFTGTAVDVSAFPSVTLAVKTDYAGAMYVDFSPDGTNWDSTLTYAVAAAVNEVHRLTVTRKYFRVRFTNTSASNQTYFRLQCLAGEQIGLSAPANLAIGQDADAITVRPTDADLETARGLRTGISAAIKFGRTLAATTGTDVWAVGTAFVQPATAAAITIVSSAANDTSAGTGARTVYVEYIDSNYATATTTVTMNGTTPVYVGTGWHVNRAYVVTAGSNDGAVGSLTLLSAAAGTPILARILATYNHTMSTIYMVPVGYSLYMKNWHAGIQSANANGTADIGLFYKPFGGVFRIQDNMNFREGGTTSDNHEYSTYRVFDEKSIIKVRVIAASHASDCNSVYSSKLVLN